MEESWKRILYLQGLPRLEEALKMGWPLKDTGINHCPICGTIVSKEGNNKHAHYILMSAVGLGLKVVWI
ncbi:hypothetical protein Y1Q_0003718 [Alligator mississippiensis]|uniref:Uncharacterized protein n=1 Tax=Alligator mississippiensis TaxID=8496 RepID=A0A151MNF3_ALLMI|nr:hypothetical protein Y1Q_0003718 [Alligator mississippiensis]